MTIKPDNHAVFATSRTLNREAFTGAVVNFTGISIDCADDGAGMDVVGRISKAGKDEARCLPKLKTLKLVAGATGRINRNKTSSEKA